MIRSSVKRQRVWMFNK